MLQNDDDDKHSLNKNDMVSFVMWDWNISCWDAIRREGVGTGPDWIGMVVFGVLGIFIEKDLGGWSEGTQK